MENKESETLEYKESTSELNEACESVCAFLNQRGGELYFGIKNNGEIIGIKDISDKTIINVTQKLSDNIKPKSIFNINHQNIEGKNIIKIEVKKSYTPYHTCKDKPYIRMGNTTRIMPIEEYQRRLVRYQNVPTDYSSIIISEASYSDLSETAIETLRKLLIQSNRYKVDITALSNEQMLKDLLLIRDNKLTVASLILLGTENALAQLLSFAEIRYGYKIDDNEIRFQDTVIYRGGYLLHYNNIWEKIDSRSINISIPIGMRLVDRRSFDEQTIREAVNNAVVHRDYQISESCFIFQSPNQIEIKSPGGFPEGVNIQNVIDESKPRNKFLADILFKCEMVEQFGTGVNLMYKNQLSLGKNPPDYNSTSDSHVILKLDGTIQDIDFAKYVIKIAENKNKILNDEELILLNKIKKNQKIFDSNLVNELLESELIERSGYEKYMLSKQYYEDTSQKGRYTKIKGIDKNRQKELILQHLRNFKSAKKQEFSQIFQHELTERQIGHLLETLKREGKIYFEGKARSTTGVWKLING